MRKVLRKVKSQWVVLGVMGATVVSLGTANIQKVSAAETEGTGIIETIEQTGSTVASDEPITILEEETIIEEVVDSNLDEGETTTPKDEIIAVGTKDVTAPVIDGSSISLVKTSVTQGESINVSVNITDDSGIASASMSYLSPITGESETIALYKNEISGLFEGAFMVTDATELGVWKCNSIEAYDTQGNSALLADSDADLSGAVFTVNETTDADTKSVMQASSSVEGLQALVASEEVTELSAAVVAPTEVQETPVVNLAIEGTVSTSVPFDNIAYATNAQTGNTAEYARGTSGLQWVQMDLGASYDLNEIQLWHYYGDSRSYRDVIVQLSNDATFANGAVTVFNNDTNGSAGLGVGTDSEYNETSAGKTISFDTMNARYARFYSNGSTVNGANHYVEIEVYGAEPQATPTVNLVPESTLTSSVSFDNLPYASDTKADNTAEYARGTSGLQWVQADLGASYDINEIQLWHYYGDSRSYHDVIVQLSNDATFANGAVTVFNNDTNGSAGLGLGTDSEYSETSAGKTISFAVVNARYARFYSNGSTVNGANHYVEIEVYGVEPQAAPTVNLAPEGTLSSSIPFDNSSFATDKLADDTADYARGTSGLQWMQVDLGASYDLNEIQLWHYFGDGRSYHDVVVQLSDDATFSTGAVTVFNNDTDGSAGLGVGTDSEYSETSAGKVISFNAVNARYARFYSNGSTVNGANHYVEIEVYGVEPQIVPTVNLAPAGTISSSVPFDNSAFATDKLADDTADYARGTSGLQWMQVDLGAAYDLNEIQLWHYFGDGRSYRDVVVQLSNDATFSNGAVTVFNNDKDGSAGLGVGTDSEYRETSAGKTISFATVNARYARFYSNGSTVNGANHYVEIEVYGTQGTMKSLTVTAAGDTSIVLNGKTLQMSATAALEDATEASVLWSVENGTGTATIDEYGLLTAATAGTVTVKASAKKGLTVLGIKEITVALPVTVTGYTGTETDIIIPERIMGTQKGEAGNYDGFNIAEILDADKLGIVTGIGFNAFFNKQLTSVVIPDSMTSIGNYAFYSNQLTSVEIPDSVTSIGDGAFYSNRLTSVVIPDSVTSIGNFAFCSNRLTSIVIPDSITSIGNYAFGYNQLTSVEIPDSVTSIGASAFGYNQLTHIEIPTSVTSIGDGAFGGNQLTSVEIPDSLTNIGAYAFYNNKLTSVVIPDSVTSIGDGAFYNNKLTSVVIPDSVTSIGDGAFGGNQLTSVEIPDSVTSIGASAFGYNQLTHIEIPTSVTSIGGGAFAGNQLTSVEIPFSVTSIGDDAFRDNQLTSLVISEGVTSIGSNAFEWNKLTSVEIPSSVTSIGASAFSGNQLTSIEIPFSVTRIGDGAFSSNQLTKVVISEGVTSIGDYAFIGNQLTSIEIPSSVTSIGACAFWSNELTSVEIPSSVISIGSEAFMDNQLTSVVISEGVTSIGSRAFSGNRLTSVVIPTSVISIGDYAFYTNQLTNLEISEGVKNLGNEAFSFNKLTNVVIPSSVTNIGAYTFRSNQLTSVTISEGVTSIEEGAFLNNQLTNVAISEGVTSIGSRAFSWNNLTEVVIPDSVTSIGSEAFYHNQLTSVEIPDSVTSIGDGAFGGNRLTSVEIPSSVTSIGNDVFSGNQLTNVKIPTSVTSIGDSAFGSNQLTSVEIPDSVTSIGAYAFYNNQLTSVEIPASVTIIGNSAFSGNQLTSVEIPASVTSIGASAFRDNQLTSVVISEGATSIGASAFAWNQLTSVEIPASVTSIGSNAFYHNVLRSVVIPDGVTSIGASAFDYNQLTSIIIPDSVTSIGSYAFFQNLFNSITIGEGVQIADNLLGTSNNFRTAYTTGGAGTYTGTQNGIQNGEWVKISI